MGLESNSQNMISWISKSSGSEAVAGLGTLIFVGLFAVSPIAFILVNSFNIASPGHPFRGGLQGWSDAFGDGKTLSAVGYSFLLSIRSFVGVAIAFAVSWLLVRIRIPGRAVIEFFLWVAFFLPTLPITLGWILLLDPNYGVLNQLLMKLPFIERAPFSIYSVGGIMWVHLTLTTVPVMTILLMPALRQFDAAIEESARVCGSGPWGILRRITLPILSPAILTVTIAGLIRSLEAFEIEQLLGTPAGIDVYSTRIFEMISWEPPRFPAAMALSSFFLAILFILALFYQRFTQKREFATVGTRGISLRPMMVGQWRYLASGICLLCSALWIILPMLMLIIGSFMRLYGFFSVKAPFTVQHWLSALRDPLLLVCLKNSLVIALGVGIFGLAVYAMIAYVIVRTQIPARAIISILAWLPWAVPGILLGVALLWLLLSLPGISIDLWHIRSVDPGFDYQRDAHRHSYDENRAGTDLQRIGRGVVGLRRRPLHDFLANFTAADHPHPDQHLRHSSDRRAARHQHDDSSGHGENPSFVRSHARVFARRTTRGRFDYRRPDHNGGGWHGDDGAPRRLENEHRIVRKSRNDLLTCLI